MSEGVKRGFSQEVLDIIKNSFNMYDLDRNGFIEIKELKQLMKQQAPQLTEEEVQEVIQEFLETHDFDHDGKVSLEEFKKTFENY